jgi:hypothetical protein
MRKSSISNKICAGTFPNSGLVKIFAAMKI